MSASRCRLWRSKSDDALSPSDDLFTLRLAESKRPSMSSLLLLETDDDRFLGLRSMNLAASVLVTLSRLRPLECDRFRGRLFLCLASFGDRLLLLLRDLPIM